MNYSSSKQHISFVSICHTTYNEHCIRLVPKKVHIEEHKECWCISKESICCSFM